MMNDDEDEYDTGKSCMDLESEESTLAATKRRRAQTQKGSKDRKKAKDAESEKEANFSISLFDQDQLNFFFVIATVDSGRRLGAKIGKVVEGNVLIYLDHDCFWKTSQFLFRDKRLDFKMQSAFMVKIGPKSQRLLRREL
jgi:hypothetical protein